MTEKQAAHDPIVLRAIAHPTRNRILGELGAAGPLRAADIARELGIPANRASFHLRQLAKYGLIEEDAGAARDRRDRVWRLSGDGELDVNLGAIEAAPGGKAAAGVFRRSAQGWAHHVVDSALAPRPDPDSYRSTSEHSVKLTKDEARELSEALREVVEQWAARTRADAAGGGGPDRRTYLLYSVLQPYPDLPED
ncbi:helix-turn-helix domain-containing protein [Nocardioides sp. 503]|uniref:ArsR/SmtB family transcription factor n=1 Tax=Nocardioides sp. 503 TaxID=2508326 RepID=UPI0010706562|nr:helix-turn-helix domain-containing protein [Nocardioides sp. 503]